MSEKTTGRGLAQDTIESLRHQRNLLGEALGRVLIHYGVIRSDVALTGPELLLAAETAISVDQKPQNSSTVPTGWLCGVLKLLNEMAGEGIGIQDCEDPAELMCEIAEHLGCDEADDPWEASLLKLKECLRG